MSSSACDDVNGCGGELHLSCLWGGVGVCCFGLG